VAAPVALRALLRASPGAWVLALALPIVLVHVDFQPGFHVSVGGTGVHVVLSDLAVIACLLAALAVAARRGPGLLRPGLWAWVALAFFLALVVAASFYGRIESHQYPWRDHLVTAGKYVEYALLAPAAVLLVRRRADLELLVFTVVAAGVVASALSVAQFLGWRIVEGWPAGYRQPSFLGHHDFAALSGLALAVALVAIAVPAWRIDRRLAAAGGVAGTVGLLVSGSLAGAFGLLAAGALAAVVARASLRRAGAVLGISLVVFGGVVLFRGGDVKSFLHQLGIGKKQEHARVESYVQRTMLAELGWRIFLRHKVAGAGWQASGDEYVYAPFLPLLHREYPNTPEQGFPSPAHPYGVQNAYVQALSDLGAIGLLLLLAALLTPLALAGRRLLRGPPRPATLLAATWLLVPMGVLTAIGLVAGIPTDALLWLAVGLCAAPALQAGSDPV
jgi:O-Antigen ligase